MTPVQQQAEWTYEVPKAGAGSAGLEEYQVETSSGEHTGKVMTVLRKEESIYLAVETGTLQSSAIFEPFRGATLRRLITLL